MKITNLKKLKPKQLIVFDMDGTLTPSKAPMDAEMTQLVSQLLAAKKVAVIGGGKYSLFKQQLLQPLKVKKELLKNLFLFPTTSTAFYRYNSGWKNVYALQLSKQERDKIKQTFKRVFQEIGYKNPEKTYGKVITARL
jgi:hydroxymethylpyrimidine pyrophosphatase-like HAD family hydrolase